MVLYEGGFIQLVLLIILWLIYLYWGWPSRIDSHIKHQSGEYEKQSNTFNIVAVIILFTIYVSLVLLGQAEDRPWQQPGTAFNALLITAAILFTAIRLFPPTFHPIFSPIINYEDGSRGRGVYELRIPKDKNHPVCLAIINTSTFTWDNYRITIALPDSFKAEKLALNEYPKCKDWDYAAESESLMIGKGYVQKKSNTVLTLGETLVTRFFVKADKVGSYETTIMMTSAGRIGERRQHLRIIVVEEVI